MSLPNEGTINFLWFISPFFILIMLVILLAGIKDIVKAWRGVK